MGAVKMNITLPFKTADNLKKKVKPRERSKVIAEALDLYFKKSSRTKLIKELIEAYSVRAEERSEIQDDWDATLKDGLDDETW